MYYNMELNLSELDNLNTMNPYETFDYNSYEQNQNYWENNNQKKSEIPTKKKISFNDILSNMNLVVNQQGVLQFMIPTQQDEQKYKELVNNQKSKEFSNISQNYNQTKQQSNIEPLDSSVKHSYIYNKYFKDYNDPNAHKEGPRIPRSIEEYHQMVLEDRRKTIELKLRLEEMKSKKLMFTAAQGMNINPRNIQSTKNNLRIMSFR